MSEAIKDTITADHHSCDISAEPHATDLTMHWLRRIQQDDYSAFQQLFNAYKNRIFSFINHLINNPVDAEELTQDVFVKLWVKRQSIDPSCPVDAFLFTVSRNCVYDYLRKKLNHKKYLETLSKDIASDNSCIEYIYYKEAEKVLHELISKLPPKRHKIFMMNRFEGKSYRTIANELGVSENTVDSQIRKALQFLRTHYPELTKLILLFS